MQFYEARLLTNATVVNDAIRSLSDYSNNNKKLSLRKGASTFPMLLRLPKDDV
jgi:hypothetical protein